MNTSLTTIGRVPWQHSGRRWCIKHLLLLLHCRKVKCCHLILNDRLEKVSAMFYNHIASLKSIESTYSNQELINIECADFKRLLNRDIWLLLCYLCNKIVKKTHRFFNIHLIVFSKLLDELVMRSPNVLISIYLLPCILKEINFVS